MPSATNSRAKYLGDRHRLTGINLDEHQSRSHALLVSFLLHYKWPIAAGVIPRLANVGFSFAQPFLVQRVLDFMDEPDSPTSQYQAYGLIAAYAIVYVGLAVRASESGRCCRVKMG